VLTCQTCNLGNEIETTPQNANKKKCETQFPINSMLRDKIEKILIK